MFHKICFCKIANFYLSRPWGRYQRGTNFSILWEILFLWLLIFWMKIMAKIDLKISHVLLCISKSVEATLIELGSEFAKLWKNLLSYQCPYSTNMEGKHFSEIFNNLARTLISKQHILINFFDPSKYFHPNCLWNNLIK